MQKHQNAEQARVSRGLSYTTKYVILFGVLLLVTNLLLGSVILSQSVSTVRKMVRKSMLSMANTAASLIDGDVVGGFTEEDVGSDEYEFILSELSAFQNNTDIEYIYLVRQDGEDHFIFTVDADPEDPAAFGESVLVTDALRSAAKGTAKVDTEPAQDKWGNYYSSYSPVYDSKGNIAGIVGVDFDAGWYDRQIMENSKSIAIFSLVSFLVTLLLLLVVTGNVRRKFEELNNDLSILASDVDELANDLVNDPEYRRTDSDRYEKEPESYSDLSAAEIEALSGRIRSMHTDIKTYIDYVHDKALTDALTDISNTTAYMEKVAELNEAISAGRASFHIAIFDINYLKHLNDEFGHLCGDRVIRATAALIAGVFGVKNTFRIGGDEFLAIAEGVSDREMADRLKKYDEAVGLYNEKNSGMDGKISTSTGVAAYRPGEDKEYKSVFIRADKDLYVNKAAFHKEHNISCT